MLLRPHSILLAAGAFAMSLGCAKEASEGGSGGTVPRDGGSGGGPSADARSASDRSSSGGTELGAGTGGSGHCPPPSGKQHACGELQLAAPPSVKQRFASNAWDANVMSGTMLPGTYVLTDLIQNGQKTSCTREVSAVLVFGTDGSMSYRWDEAGVSNTFTARYTAGGRGGTVLFTVDCPKNLAGQASGIAFQATETGFTMTYSDGLVHVFTRK